MDTGVMFLFFITAQKHILQLPRRGGALERSVIDFLGIKHDLLDPSPFASAVVWWFETFSSHEDFPNPLMNHSL